MFRGRENFGRPQGVIVVGEMFSVMIVWLACGNQVQASHTVFIFLAALHLHQMIVTNVQVKKHYEKHVQDLITRVTLSVQQD